MSIFIPKIEKYYQVVAKSHSEKSSKAPKEWWDKMFKSIRKDNPSYSEEVARKTVGRIWSDLSDSKKSEIRKRYGKTYGPAKKAA